MFYYKEQLCGLHVKTKHVVRKHNIFDFFFLKVICLYDVSVITIYRLQISEVPLRSCESSHAMSRKTKSLTKLFLRLQRRLDHLQRIVKGTCWSDRVSRVDVSLSFLSSRRKKVC